MDIVCVEGQQATGDSSMIGKKAAPLGAIGCVDPDAIAYRRTLPESIAGPPNGPQGTDGLATINIYGLFENGFDSNVPGFGCLGSNTVCICVLHARSSQPDTNPNPNPMIDITHLQPPQARARAPNPQPENHAARGRGRHGDG